MHYRLAYQYEKIIQFKMMYELNETKLCQPQVWKGSSQQISVFPVTQDIVQVLPQASLDHYLELCKWDYVTVLWSMPHSFL
jgi:hypothetical protein